MNDNEKLAVIGLGVIAFLIWKKRQPGTMMFAAPAIVLPKPPLPIYQTAVGSMSPVRQSNSTSQLATNPSSLFANVIAYDPGWGITTRPGNAPQSIYPNSGGFTSQDVGQPANGFTALAAPTAALADVVPFWQVDPAFANPAPNDWSGLAYSQPSIAAFMAKPNVY